MKKRILLTLIAAVLLFALGGCDMVSFDVSELMSPPKPTGEKAEIQKLIDKEAGTDYTLKYPQNGSFRSAITTMDFDSDSVDEAIAFYLPAGEGQTIHLLIMDQIDNKWKVIGNHTSKSTMVDRLLFTDLDGDGTREIVVGYSTYNTLVNDLAVYLVNSDNTSTEILSETKYSDFLSGNFTNSAKEELLLLSLYSTDRPASAVLVALNDTKNSLYTVSETAIDADVTSFAKLQTGNVFENQYGAVLDGITSAGAYNTQILYYDKQLSSLTRMYFTEDTPTNQAARNYAVLSEDIDNDGVIEIPNTFKMNIDSAQTDAVPAPLIYWCEYTSSGFLSTDKTEAASLVYSCRFTIPEKWKNYTAYVNYSTSEITFYEWKEDNTLGEALLVIKIFTHEQYGDGTSAKGYTELAKSDSYVYTFITFETNSSMLLTNEEITEAFSVA